MCLLTRGKACNDTSQGMALISGVRDCMCLQCVHAFLDGDASDKNFCLFGVFPVFDGTLFFSNNTLHWTLKVCA